MCDHIYCGLHAVATLWLSFRIRIAYWASDWACLAKFELACKVLKSYVYASIYVDFEVAQYSRALAMDALPNKLDITGLQNWREDIMMDLSIRCKQWIIERPTQWLGIEAGADRITSNVSVGYILPHKWTSLHLSGLVYNTVVAPIV